MIRYQSTEPQPQGVQGYRFIPHMPDMPAFDFNNAAGIFKKHPRTGAITHKYNELRDLKIIHVRSAAELLAIKRDFDPTVLAHSYVTYGNNWLGFNSFFITPTYGGDSHENEELADMVIRLMHRGSRKVACSLMVTSDKPISFGESNEALFRRIRIRDTKYNQQRIVVPKMIVDRSELFERKVSYRDTFARPGQFLLSGIADMQTGIHANEGVYYVRFHIRNLNMFSSEGHLRPVTTQPEDWVKKRGYPATSAAPTP